MWKRHLRPREIWVYRTCLITPQNAKDHGRPQSFGSHYRNHWWLATFPDRTWIMAENKKDARRHIDDHWERALPSGPLTADFFRVLPKGATLLLHYWCTNKGTMEWQHHTTILMPEYRVVGRFRYPGCKWSEPGSHLYEFAGVICRGSGAEPVHAIEPTRRDMSL